MPKQKQFLKQSKKSKRTPQAPTTADEYLEAGVEFEEAGEKWRGGDAAKSTRFFVRAIDCYDEALKKFPKSFDLAYNKARVQFELTQHPKLKDQLPGDLLDLLKTALDSSRYALALKEDNADVLFNTAQVLTSLAQALESGDDSLLLLQEAIELFQRCLNLQEYYYTEYLSRDETREASPGPSGDATVPDSNASLVDEDVTPSRSEIEERWATVVEPVTQNTLLDTIIAQLEVLTTLSSVILIKGATKDLVWIEEYFAKHLEPKIQDYMVATDRVSETLLTCAYFKVSLADAYFRSGWTDIKTYGNAIEDPFKNLDLSANPEGLVGRAETLITFNSSVRGFPDMAIHKDVVPVRWNALSQALDLLTEASKIVGVTDVEKIHVLRGDCEMLRGMLAEEGYSDEFASKNRPLLLKNAETIYRKAGGKIEEIEEIVKNAKEASVKMVLAAALREQSWNGLEDWIKRGGSYIKAVIDEAIEDGLLRPDHLKDVQLN